MAFRLKSNRSVPAAIALAAVVGLGGCGPSPPPKFTLGAKTRELLPDVLTGLTVKDDAGKDVRVPGLLAAVDSRFGTPSEPVVWPLLPIDFGGVAAAVESVVAPTPEDAAKAEEGGQPFQELILALQESKDAPAVPVGSQLAWAPGSVYEGQAFRVKAFDPKTRRVTLAGSFANGLPAVGDGLLLNAGPTLERGRELYAHHCLHCHGAGGAGDGPTAKYLDPKPRDYRLGVYKFTSTANIEKASRVDLAAVLRHGIPGTAMPAYQWMGDDDLHAVVEYVRWLSLRGEYENILASYPFANELTKKAINDRVAAGEKRDEIIAADVKDFLQGDFAELPQSEGEGVASSWANADAPEAVVTPTSPRVADTPESRARGRELYLSDRTKCASCHGPYGRGDGPQSEEFQRNLATNQQYPLPGLYDQWDNPIKPRDLTQGMFRGGRRPVDLYRRIHAGIKGTPMPAFGSGLKEEEIWDLVNFVLHVPFEPLPEAGRGKSLVSSTSH